MSDTALPVISALVERQRNGFLELLLQTRIADYDRLYFGSLEIPAGRIDAGENIFQTIRREVAEETGYRVTSIEGEESNIISGSNNGALGQAFQPFCCQQLLNANFPWVGFVFRCQVSDAPELSLDSSAKDHTWVTEEQLSQILISQRERIFTLQLPVLEFYLKAIRSAG